MKRGLIATIALFLLGASSAFAQYEQYEDGLKAARNENWTAVVSKMSEAIAKMPNENANWRPYGNNFVKYHPYYYRGIAYFNLGQFDKAEGDLKRAKGVGPVALGSLDSWQSRIETKLAQSQAPAAQPAAVQQAPPSSMPSVPVAQVDPNLGPAKSRASQMIAAAQDSMQRAQTRNAATLASNQFQNAQTLFLQAREENVNAETSADFNRAAQTAERAKKTFDLAIDAAQMAAVNQKAVPGRAVEEILGSTRDRVKSALGEYFAGNYSSAASQLQALTSKDLSSNHVAHAFLGAARYHQYILSGRSNTTYLRQADDAFSKARKLKPDYSLSSRYFSPRVQRHYQTIRTARR